MWPAGAWAERALCVCGGWGGGGAGNRIGAEGAAAVARALESGRCGLTSLNLGCEWDRWYSAQRITALHCNVLRCIAMPYWAAFSRVCDCTRLGGIWARTAVI